MSFLGKVLRTLLVPFRQKRLILFESHPNMADNAYPVYLYFKEHKPEYKLLWMNSRKSSVSSPNQLYYNSQNTWQQIRFFFLIRTCGAIVTCDRFFKSHYDGQISLYLAHGSKTKKTRGIYEPGPIVDFVNLQSHFFDSVAEYDYRARKEQLVYLGYPRCDWLYKNVDLSAFLKKIGVTGKYIIWLPTFRKNKAFKLDAHSELFDNMGIPLIYNEEMLRSLNEFLIGRDYHIVYKPHPAQDVRTLTRMRLSNIHIINDEYLHEQGVQLYQMIAKSSALITDYSSVYYDYLLLDKPIATTLDDVETWKSARGFAFDLESMYASTNESLYTLDDLYSFIDDVLVEGKDTRGEERRKIRDLTNIYTDGNSAQRVAEFIISKTARK